MGKLAYVRLDDEDYKKLVAGKEIVLKDDVRGVEVHLILADIGWDRMLGHIETAMTGPAEERS